MKILKFMRMLDANDGAGNGNDTGANVDNTDNSSQDDSTVEKEKQKTFTQEEVNAMMTREKKQGKNSVLKALGFEKEEDAQKAIKAYQAFLDSQKTEDEKNNETVAEQQKELLETKRRADLAEAKVTAMKLGVKPQNVDDIVTLALANKTDDAELKDVIGELKKKYPNSFSENGDVVEGKKGTGSSLLGSKKKTSNNDGNEGAEKSLGARLAAKRRTSKKSSFFK